MALVNIESAQKRILEQLRKMPVRQGVEVLSYKRNRGISLIRAGGDTVTVRERGYRDREMTVTLPALPKLLKVMMGTEFPRSRKVRLYRLEDAERAGRERKRL